MHPLFGVQWRVREQPILSAMTTRLSWCRVTLYNPTVVKRGQEYLLWFVGNSSQTRAPDHSLGLARSTDGVHFEPVGDEPVLRGSDLPFGRGIHTPHVLWNDDLQRFDLWFSAIDADAIQAERMVNVVQLLGHAHSRDGIHWQVNPQPLWRQLRGPCVWRDATGYQMWAGAAPEPTDDFGEIVSRIWRFTSPDGLNWRRDAHPCVQPTPAIASTVYPCVHVHQGQYILWYGCHVPKPQGGGFQLYASTSDDGLTWTHHHDVPALPRSGDRARFDGHYTSTPSLVLEPGRALLYYSTRDLDMLFGRGDGAIGVDRQGIYRHIGVAEADWPG